MKRLAKGVLRALGMTVSRRDRLAEMIPPDYLQSPYLPRVYRQSLGRILYFKDMVDRVDGLRGDVVECGVSIGHGLLYFMLLSDLLGAERRFYGFDSFEGFPASTAEDRKASGHFQVDAGDYRTPAHLVSVVLRDGRVSEAAIGKLRLIQGNFEHTLGAYDGEIALLHLDCDLYDSYTTCLSRLYPRVVPGGLILFDEYDDPNFPGARRAVDQFFADKPETIRSQDLYQYQKFYVVKAGGS
jgi:hypothetical protein